MAVLATIRRTLRARGRADRSRPGAAVRTPARGQSLTEFALLLPALLLLALLALDFGRALQGWAILQNAARVAANFASLNPTAWVDLSDTSLDVIREKYTLLVGDSTAGIDCPLDTIAAPTVPSDTSIGQPVVATVSCRFSMATPLIASVLPNPMTLTATAAFPIRNGGVGVNIADSKISAPLVVNDGELVTFYDLSGNSTMWCWNFGDGFAWPYCDSPVSPATHTFHHTCTTPDASNYCVYTVTLRASTAAGFTTTSTWSIKVRPIAPTPAPTPTPPPPTATFTATPGSGNTPLTVNLVDTTTGDTSWCWNFGDGASWPTCDSTVESLTHTYVCGSGTCSFTVRHTASNAWGTSAVATAVVVVNSPVPVPGTCFSPTSGSGTGSMTLTFNSTCTTNSPYAWCWNFGDNLGAYPLGTCQDTTQNPTHVFGVGGPYTVNLTATNAGGSATVSHSPFTVGQSVCTVPNFSGMSVVGSAAITSIQNLWTGRGFTLANLSFYPLPLPTKGSHTIQAITTTGHIWTGGQSLTANSNQYCTASIELTWK